MALDIRDWPATDTVWHMMPKQAMARQLAARDLPALV